MDKIGILKLLRQGIRIRHVSREMSGKVGGDRRWHDLWIGSNVVHDRENDAHLNLQELVAEGKIVEVEEPGMIVYELNAKEKADVGADTQGR